jgi:hypothetical protein
MMPRLRLTLASDIALSPSWVITSKTRLVSVRPLTESERDQCRVTLFKVDVTDRVVNAIRPLVSRKLVAVDQRIGRFDLRTRVEKWYNLLNRSIRIRDSLWLMLSPDAVRLGGLRLVDTALVADIRLFAQPMIVAGPRPAVVTTTLPPLDPVQREMTDSVLLRLEGILPYDVASAILSRALNGKAIRRFGRTVNITKAQLSALGDGRVVLGIGLSGAITGDAYFVGTPQLDTVQRMLTVPDLDFDVATADALVQSLAWVKKGDLVQSLRARARVPVSALIDSTRDNVERAINRELADGVHLAGEVHAGRLVDVVAQKDWLLVRAEATGALSLGIDRELKFRRPRDRRTGAATSSRRDTTATAPRN